MNVIRTRRMVAALCALVAATLACNASSAVVPSSMPPPAGTSTVSPGELPTQPPTASPEPTASPQPTASPAPTSEQPAIHSYLQSLDYDPASLLNVQDTGGQDAKRTAQEADTSETEDGNFTRTCVRTNYSLEQNFEDVAILRPTAGVIWPGAVVQGNDSLLDGLPEPVALPRAPVTFKVDLPGIGANGIKTVENPTNSSVQAAIDDSLAWWNDNAYQEGYVNAANSSYRLSSSYSSQQLALDVGLNVEWAVGDVSAQFDYTTSETKRVVMAVYKQAFYTVSLDIPASPESVLADTVTLDQVQAALNPAAPPAYVTSVTYGRIIMLRMETSESATAEEVETAFRYASTADVSGSLDARSQQIIENSSIEVVTLGGNAAVASRAVTTGDPDQTIAEIQSIIQGENAVYSKSNPGVPIAYTVRYLKDNSLAKMGYTTDYTATECSALQTRNTITVTLDRFYVWRDCDSVGGKGDFEFKAQVSGGSGSPFIVSRRVTLGRESSSLIRQDTSFVLPREAGQLFRVDFWSSEWDVSVFGKDYRDASMNNMHGSVVHRFENGSWTSIGGEDDGVIRIRNNGGSQCQAELWYTVTVQ
jgi:thiol-activated cytolysin